MAIVWAGALVLFVVLYFLTISPQSKTLAKLSADLVEKQKTYEVAVAAAQQDNQKRLADEVESLKSRLAGYVIESEESANLTFDISRIAGDKQVSSFTIRASEQIRSADLIDIKNLQENAVVITFASNFKQFAAFLNALERHRPSVFVDRFKMVREDQAGNAQKVDMELAFFVKKRPEG